MIVVHTQPNLAVHPNARCRDRARRFRVLAPGDRLIVLNQKQSKTISIPNLVRPLFSFRQIQPLPVLKKTKINQIPPDPSSVLRPPSPILAHA